MSAALLSAVKTYILALDAYKLESLAADRTRRLKALRALTDAELLLRSVASVTERNEAARAALRPIDCGRPHPQPFCTCSACEEAR